MLSTMFRTVIGLAFAALAAQAPGFAAAYQQYLRGNVEAYRAEAAAADRFWQNFQQSYQPPSWSPAGQSRDSLTAAAAENGGGALRRYDGLNVGGAPTGYAAPGGDPYASPVSAMGVPTRTAFQVTEDYYQGLKARAEQAEALYSGLAQAAPLMQPVVILQKVFEYGRTPAGIRNTAEEYKFSLPITIEGGVYAVAGFFLGSLFSALISFLFSRRHPRPASS